MLPSAYVMPFIHSGPQGCPIPLPPVPPALVPAADELPPAELPAVVVVLPPVPGPPPPAVIRGLVPALSSPLVRGPSTPPPQPRASPQQSPSPIRNVAVSFMTMHQW